MNLPGFKGLLLKPRASPGPRSGTGSGRVTDLHNDVRNGKARKLGVMLVSIFSAAVALYAADMGRDCITANAGSHHVLCHSQSESQGWARQDILTLVPFHFPA